jgi:hypothetical protein
MTQHRVLDKNTNKFVFKVSKRGQEIVKGRAKVITPSSPKGKKLLTSTKKAKKKNVVKKKQKSMSSPPLNKTGKLSQRLFRNLEQDTIKCMKNDAACKKEKTLKKYLSLKEMKCFVLPTLDLIMRDVKAYTAKKKFKTDILAGQKNKMEKISALVKVSCALKKELNRRKKKITK